MNAKSRLFLSISLACFALAACATGPSAVSQEPLTNALSKNQTLASYQNAPEALRVWVDGRAGIGEPVHWVSDGFVYEYPSGKKLFGLMGFDSSRAFWPEKEGESVVHLTRKTFAYTDLETGEVIREYNGKEIKPIAYPYQMITYRLENERIYGDVEQGVGERVQQIKSKDGIPFRQIGDSYVYNAQVYLDFALPSGTQYEAWENYDFFFHPEGTVSEPHQMTWQRYGKLPAWAGGGQAITRLHSWRVESHAEFPEPLLTWAKADKVKWLNAPASIEEIRALQKGEGGPGWGG